MHTPTLTILLLVLLAGWLALVGIGHAMARHSPRAEARYALGWLALRAYVRIVHRLRVQGTEQIPRSRVPGPLIIVANHTAGVDPVLIQMALPFHIRWMMARDMQVRALRDIWEWLGVIPVDRQARDTRSAREALRALRAGEVVGVFPEGRIERPAGRLLPFLPGIGLLAASSGAPVLPVLIRGTPITETAWESLVQPSRASLVFGPLMRWNRGESADQMQRDIRAWFEAQMRSDG